MENESSKSSTTSEKNSKQTEINFAEFLNSYMGYSQEESNNIGNSYSENSLSTMVTTSESDSSSSKLSSGKATSTSSFDDKSDNYNDIDITYVSEEDRKIIQLMADQCRSDVKTATTFFYKHYKPNVDLISSLDNAKTPAPGHK